MTTKSHESAQAGGWFHYHSLLALSLYMYRWTFSLSWMGRWSFSLHFAIFGHSTSEFVVIIAAYRIGRYPLLFALSPVSFNVHWTLVGSVWFSIIFHNATNDFFALHRAAPDVLTAHLPALLHLVQLHFLQGDFFALLRRLGFCFHMPLNVSRSQNASSALLQSRRKCTSATKSIYNDRRRRWNLRPSSMSSVRRQLGTAEGIGAWRETRRNGPPVPCGSQRCSLLHYIKCAIFSCDYGCIIHFSHAVQNNLPAPWTMKSTQPKTYKQWINGIFAWLLRYEVRPFHGSGLNCLCEAARTTLSSLLQCAWWAS